MTPEPIERLIGTLARLPGIGERTAGRLAYHIIRVSRQQHGHGGISLAQDLAAALLEVHEKVSLCRVCQNLCAMQRCWVCRDLQRDTKTICVVEGVADLRAIEKSGAHRGVYHVLHGALAPLDGMGPQDLKLAELIHRIKEDGCDELILATNANVEGDATALYIARLVQPLGMKVTRLASGIPLGGELEYLDHATLGRALLERRDFA